MQSRQQSHKAIGSFGIDPELYVPSELFFGQLAEEANFVFARRLPPVVLLELCLQMSLYVDVESLRLQVIERRIVHTGLD